MARTKQASKAKPKGTVSKTKPKLGKDIVAESVTTHLSPLAQSTTTTTSTTTSGRGKKGTGSPAVGGHGGGSKRSASASVATAAVGGATSRSRSTSVMPGEGGLAGKEAAPEPAEEEAVVDDKLYCVCKTPYDEDRVMIACDRYVSCVLSRFPCCMFCPFRPDHLWLCVGATSGIIPSVFKCQTTRSTWLTSLYARCVSPVRVFFTFTSQPSNIHHYEYLYQTIQVSPGLRTRNAAGQDSNTPIPPLPKLAINQPEAPSPSIAQTNAELLTCNTVSKPGAATRRVYGIA